MVASCEFLQRQAVLLGYLVELGSDDLLALTCHVYANQ
jgi:hypothetical protein